VAVWLGILKMLEMDPVWILLLTSWLIVIGVVRVAFGVNVAIALSVAVAMILILVLSLLYLALPHRYPISDVQGWMVTGLMGGAFLGLTMFGIAEGLVRAVNWVDSLMETKSDE